MGETVCLLLFGGIGVLSSVLFYRSENLRSSSVGQCLALAVSILSGILTLVAFRLLSDDGAGASPGDLHKNPLAQGFFFLCAGVLHAPTVVWILLDQWDRLIQRLTSPGRRDGARRRAPTIAEEWQLISACQESLRENPLDVRHRTELGDAYLRLGLIDSAIGEFRRAVECLERGYEQAHLLFRIARLFVDRKGDRDAAQAPLRRLVRVYPRSYFASYARRVISGYEARSRPAGGGEGAAAPEDAGGDRADNG